MDTVPGKTRCYPEKWDIYDAAQTDGEVVNFRNAPGRQSCKLWWMFPESKLLFQNWTFKAAHWATWCTRSTGQEMPALYCWKRSPPRAMHAGSIKFWQTGKIYSSSYTVRAGGGGKGVSGLSGACNWKMPNSALSREKFWILLCKLL